MAVTFDVTGAGNRSATWLYQEKTSQSAPSPGDEQRAVHCIPRMRIALNQKRAEIGSLILCTEQSGCPVQTAARGGAGRAAAVGRSQS